jgi:hypothetical protein
MPLWMSSCERLCLGWSCDDLVDQLRQVAGDSHAAEAVKVLARAHQQLIGERTRHLLRLRSALREFFPAALGELCQGSWTGPRGGVVRPRWGSGDRSISAEYLA